ncbi:MAG: CotH kinase family protein [Bacteroidota bacterium]
MSKIKHVGLVLLVLSTHLSWSQTLTQSNLPIVVINTTSEIPDEPKITGFMGIIDNGTSAPNLVTDSYSEYNGRIGIETRGNSTQDFAKKTYSVELRTEDDQDRSVNLFGMGREEDWILHAMVIDKSQLRIPMSFDFFRFMGYYASKWRYVELILNGEYRGLYLFTERIKRDDDRVDIARLDSDDNSGDAVTGGYILRIDWLFDDPEGFVSDFESQEGTEMLFQWYYPRAENITSQQRNYIQNWMRDFESALFSETYINAKGFRYDHYIDVASFADFFLINEISKNADGYKLSTFLHKERDSDGGRLHAGPIWDFDQTYGVSLVCSNNDFTGWTYLQNQEGCGDLESMPLWWRRLIDDPNFYALVRNRWTLFRSGFLSDEAIDNWITENVSLISEPIARNFQRWNNFLGESIWFEPEPIPEDYDAEISALRSWIRSRTNWMDAQLRRDMITSVVDNQDFEKVSVYPNPSSESFVIAGAENSILQIMDTRGSEIYKTNINAMEHVVNTTDIPAGIYILRISKASGIMSMKVMVE